jgi:cyclopropane fatty-acyl-phospholipid synthase-like methyltransferase
MHHTISPFGQHLPGSNRIQTEPAMTADPSGQREAYWNQYYFAPRDFKTQAPSQFAAFIASEYTSHPLVVDVGCGNGRDTLFFAQLGHDTLGIDGSKTAIEHCRERIRVFDSSPQKHDFKHANVADLSNDGDTLKRIAGIKKIIYSRFFLHAITPSEQTAFLEFAFASMQSEDVLALEFRTLEDEYRQKVTDAHYRRYIDLEKLKQQITQEFPGKIEYVAQGTGMAKYHSDDAHVARLLVHKVCS